jgi:hypothetical protein
VNQKLNDLSLEHHEKGDGNTSSVPTHSALDAVWANAQFFKPQEGCVAQTPVTLWTMIKSGYYHANFMVHSREQVNES